MVEPVFVQTPWPPELPTWRELVRSALESPHPLLTVLRIHGALRKWQPERADPRDIQSLALHLNAIATQIHHLPKQSERGAEEAAMATAGLARLWRDWYELSSQADASIWVLWLGVDPSATSLIDEIARLAASWDEESARRLCLEVLTRLGWDV